MKNLIFIASPCWGGMTAWAQSSEETNKECAGYEWPYHPEEDDDKRISELLKRAKGERKKVLVQIGGN